MNIVRGLHGGGWKKRGVENLTNDTPPKKGFWTPPRTVRFPPPSGVSALFFLYKNPRQSRPEALLEGSKNFRESAFSGTFSSPPYVLHPPISRHMSIELAKTPLLRSTIVSKIPPLHKTNTSQEPILGELLFARLHAGPVFALARIQRKIFLRDHFLHMSQILEGIHFGVNTCRACIHTGANTGKGSWRIFYVLVLCQGVFLQMSSAEAFLGIMPWPRKIQNKH